MNESIIVYKPEDIAKLLKIGMSSAYILIKNQLEVQEFRVLKVGKQYRIERTSFDRWVAGAGKGV